MMSIHKKLLLLILVLTLFPFNRAEAAISYENSTLDDGDNIVGINVSYTASGSDIWLGVGVCMDENTAGNRVVNSVTWDGVGLTQLSAHQPGSGDVASEIWYQNDAPAQTANLVVTLNGTNDSMGVVIASYNGVDGVGNSNSGANTGDITIALTTSVIDSYVVQHTCNEFGGRTNDATSGQTSRENGDNGGGVSQSWHDKVAATIQSYDMNVESSSSNPNMTTVVVEILEAAADAGDGYATFHCKRGLCEIKKGLAEIKK